MIQASLVAESRTKRFGEPAWSVALDQARKRIAILKKCLTMVRTRLNLNEAISTGNSALLVQIEIPWTKRECVVQLRKAKREVKDIVTTSLQQRDSERKQKLLELELSGSKRDKAQARLLRRLQRAEATKAVVAKIRTAWTNGRRAGITSVEILVHPEEDPKTCTEGRVIDVPSEVVEHLQRRNRIHFGQAHGTPLTVPPLAEELGSCADGPSCDAALTGHYDTSQFDNNVALVLQHLQQIHDVAQHPNYPTISEAELIGKLKVWRESTTTSPSGLHLGQYKALIARHQYSDDESEDACVDADGNHIQSKKAEWDYMQRELRLFNLNLINYALERGYSYTRW